MESEPMLIPREKSPLSEKFSSEEDRTHDTVSSRTVSPTHYQWTIPCPDGKFCFLLLFFFAFPSYISGVHHFWMRFLRMCPFFNPTIKVVTFRLRGWCVLGVFLLPAFTGLGHERQDLLSPCDMKCMCAQTRPRFILSSEGVFGGMEFEPMLTPREKSPLPENVPRGRSNPRHCGQRAQALPTELFRPPDSKFDLQLIPLIHPRRRNVTTSMVGLKNGYIRKNVTQNGELQRSSWGMQKKKKKIPLILSVAVCKPVQFDLSLRYTSHVALLHKQEASTPVDVCWFCCRRSRWLQENEDWMSEVCFKMCIVWMKAGGWIINTLLHGQKIRLLRKGERKWGCLRYTPLLLDMPHRLLLSVLQNGWSWWYYCCCLSRCSVSCFQCLQCTEQRRIHMMVHKDIFVDVWWFLSSLHMNHHVGQCDDSVYPSSFLITRPSCSWHL